MWKRSHLYEKAATGYDALIRGFVPAFDTMQDKICELMAEVLGEERPISVLELGVGTGILAFRLLSRFPIRYYHGFEASPHLAAFARSRLSTFSTDVTVHAQDFRRSNWPGEMDAVVSTLTFHYLSSKEKQLAFRKAYESLRPRGLFIVGDRVISSNASINEVYYSRMQRFWDITTRNWEPRTREDHKTQDDPNEEPWLLEEQMCWLKEMRFLEVECIWKDFNYCVFCGIR